MTRKEAALSFYPAPLENIDFQKEAHELILDSFRSYGLRDEGSTGRSVSLLAGHQTKLSHLFIPRRFATLKRPSSRCPFFFVFFGLEWSRISETKFVCHIFRGFVAHGFVCPDMEIMASRRFPLSHGAFPQYWR